MGLPADRSPLGVAALCLVAAASCVATAGPAHAQSWKVHGVAAGAHAVSGHQKDELGFGAAGLAAVEYGTPLFGAGIELSWLHLSQGDAPEDQALERLEGASALNAALALRVRPLASGDAANVAGLWLGGGIGGTRTDGLNRLFLDAHAGYDFMIQHGLGLGPSVGFLHVSQPDSQVRPADANVLMVGLHAVLDFTPVKMEPPKSLDRDKDGLNDDVDKCPDDPEDEDGFEDDDGCPEADNDKDGVLDVRDDCPLDPEDKDGFEDKDGCPDTDNDKDGIPDANDGCPNDPEDKDGFEDEDGCPDTDNDKDGIGDAEDLCPDEPETKNNYADHDGCPDEEQVRVVGDKIVLDDRVHFHTNSHKIRGVSYPLLRRLSKLVFEHPEYTHIAVEGHADTRGPESYNKELSQRRAESVLEFMVQEGVARDRLSAKGYGSERPLVDATNEHAHLLNRRVEFVVTRKIKVPANAAEPPPGGTPSQPDDAAAPHDPKDAEAVEDAGVDGASESSNDVAEEDTP